MTITAAKISAFADRSSTGEIEHGYSFMPKFDEHGLIPAIVTDAATGAVLMFAWMNAEALGLTLTTRVAHFYSRSRAKLWKKGEESGNLLHVIELRTDCDQDALTLAVSVAGNGVACHTGAVSCFYRTVSLEAPPSGLAFASPPQPVVK
jgi:phosphoribosyl-AMP cyclohydrolase